MLILCMCPCDWLVRGAPASLCYMRKLARIASIVFAAVVLTVVVSVCGEAFACTAVHSETCCAEAGHTLPRRETAVSVTHLGYSAASAEVRAYVPVIMVAVLPVDRRMTAPPPNLLLANLRI